MRESWIDSARGLAIILVALFHAVINLDLVGLAGPWSRLAYTLDTFRMPLFFFLSGLLAHRLLTRPLREVLRTRCLTLIYLYVLWCLLLGTFRALLPHAPAGALSGIARVLVAPDVYLWFLYTLCLFTLVGWLTRRLPAWLVVGLALVCSAVFAAGLVSTGDIAWDKTLRYWLFFVLASRAAPVVRTAVPRLRMAHVAGLGASYVVVLGFFVYVADDRIIFVRPMLGLLAVAAGCGLGVVIAGVPALGFVRHLGTRTLPVYVVHAFPVTAAQALLAGRHLDWPPGATLVAVPLLTAAAILLPLGLDRLVTGRIRGIFDFPVASWTAKRTLPPAQPAADPARLPR
ncbi:putative membrane protein YcfT [Nocardioides albertanoniae]|uniref:Putative membrane protein YcfT n=1 Tax=Nocardioides albertanoniae TaxID=1175486 RepID=A0A543ABH6_9ACTN|nr:acyltransferase family protein [Nocardioides albertanoniae]TQL69951.1 putative membrane protein YcfT [Nocardioides albertanoniae]